MIDNLDVKNKNVLVSLILLRIVKTAYDSASELLMTGGADYHTLTSNNPFVGTLFEFLQCMLGLLDNSNNRESARVAVLILAGTVMDTVELPPSYIVDILSKIFDFIGMDTYNKLKGTLALAETIDPYGLSPDLTTGALH